MINFNKLVTCIVTFLSIIATNIPSEAQHHSIEELLKATLQADSFWCSGNVNVDLIQTNNNNSSTYIVICETQNRVEAYTVKFNQNGTSEIMKGFPQ